MNKWKNRIIKKTMEIHKTCSLKQLHPIPSPISNSLTQALSCYSQCKNSVVIMLFINNFRLAVYWHLKHIWVLSLVEKKQLSKHFFTFKYLCLVSNKAYAKYIHAYDFINWFIQLIFFFFNILGCYGKRSEQSPGCRDRPTEDWRSYYLDLARHILQIRLSKYENNKTDMNSDGVRW